MNKKMLFICLFTIAVSTCQLLMGKDSNSVLIAKVSNDSIFLSDLQSEKETIKEALLKSLQKEKESLGNTLVIKEEMVEDVARKLLIIGLKNKLKSIVDNKVLRTHVDEIVSEKEINTHFIQQVGKEASTLKYYKARMDAYEYLDQHHNQENAIEEAFDKYLASRYTEQVRAKALEVWKYDAKNKLARQMEENKYNEAKDIVSGKVTDEMKTKQREYFFTIDLQSELRKNTYILNQIAKTDDKTKIYLLGKSSGKEDKNYEQEIIDKWYLGELEKLDCELVTDKYGSLKDIVTFKGKENDLIQGLLGEKYKEGKDKLREKYREPSKKEEGN